MHLRIYIYFLSRINTSEIAMNNLVMHELHIIILSISFCHECSDLIVAYPGMRFSSIACNSTNRVYVLYTPLPLIDECPLYTHICILFQNKWIKNILAYPPEGDIEQVTYTLLCNAIPCSKCPFVATLNAP